jgi:hypothetical protein
MARERGRFSKGEREKCTPRMHYNREERKRVMAKERWGDSVKGRTCAPLGCVAIEGDKEFQC